MLRPLCCVETNGFTVFIVQLLPLLSVTCSSWGFLYPGHQTVSSGHCADPSWIGVQNESVWDSHKYTPSLKLRLKQSKASHGCIFTEGFTATTSKHLLKLHFDSGIHCRRLYKKISTLQCYSLGVASCGNFLKLHSVTSRTGLLALLTSSPLGLESLKRTPAERDLLLAWVPL